MLPCLHILYPWCENLLKYSVRLPFMIFHFNITNWRNYWMNEFDHHMEIKSNKDGTKNNTWKIPDYHHLKELFIFVLLCAFMSAVSRLKPKIIIIVKKTQCDTWLSYTTLADILNANTCHKHSGVWLFLGVLSDCWSCLDCCNLFHVIVGSIIPFVFTISLWVSGLS